VLIHIRILLLDFTEATSSHGEIGAENRLVIIQKLQILRNFEKSEK
jgi:hypothetical protein